MLNYFYSHGIFVLFYVNCALLTSTSNAASYDKQSDTDLDFKDIYATPPKPGWIDPFDMLGESRYMDSSHVMAPSLNQRSDHLSDSSNCNNYKCATYLKQIVNSFLHATKLQNAPVSFDTIRRVKLEFIVTGKELSMLQNFGLHSESKEQLDSVSEVLRNIFDHNLPEENPSSLYLALEWIKKTIIKILSSPEWTVVSSLSMMLFVMLWFVYKMHSYRLALFTLFLTVFVGGFGFTWIRMYEEKEVERYANLIMHGNAPYHCRGDPMAWYEHMFYRMFGVDCIQFYKARDVRALSKVSPTEVLSETISAMFITPGKNIGMAYGSFIRSVIGYMPWWLKPIALPLSFLMPVIFFIIVLALLLDYHLKISLTGFHLMPSWSKNCIGQCNNKYVEDISREGNKNSLQTQPEVDHIAFLSGLKTILSSYGHTQNIKNKEDSNQRSQDDKQNRSQDGNQNSNGEGTSSDAVVQENNEVPTESLEESLVLSQKHEPPKKRTKSIHTIGESNFLINSCKENSSLHGDQCRFCIENNKDK